MPTWRRSSSAIWVEPQPHPAGSAQWRRMRQLRLLPPHPAGSAQWCRMRQLRLLPPHPAVSAQWSRMRQLRLTSTRAHSKHGSLAQMAELVDALLSGSSAARREGSSPFLGTIFINLRAVNRLSTAHVVMRSHRRHRTRHLCCRVWHGSRGRSSRALPAPVGRVRLERCPVLQHAF